jgi:hypothetical protein
MALRSRSSYSANAADALTTKLQQIPSLQVRPTSAVMEFRNTKVDPKAASAKRGGNHFKREPREL